MYENLDRKRNENRKWKEISGQLQCSGRRTFFPILAAFTVIFRQMRYNPTQVVLCK